jgi:vancomycin resistance protein YoaR
MKIKTKKIIFISASIVVFWLVFLLVGNFVYNKKWADTIYPNIYLNDVALSGLDKNGAKDVINRKINDFEKIGIKINLKNREIIWNNMISSLDPDLAIQPVVFDVDKTIDQAYQLGRQGNLSDIFFKINSLFFKTQINTNFSINNEEIKKTLNDNFSDLEILANNAKLNFKEEVNILGNTTTTFFIEPENSGKEIDDNVFLTEFKNNLSLLKNDQINLNLVDKQPEVTISMSQGLELEAENLLSLAPFNLVYQDKNKTFIVSQTELASWLNLEPYYLQNKIIATQVGLDDEKIIKFFDEKIKPEVNQEPILPKFEFNNDKVSSFESGTDGLKINYEQSIDNIKTAFFERNMKNIDLVVEIDPVQKIDSINDLGIEEIIGTGHSNFSGSSANRRHNIKVGASKISGLIIKPGEEFSLLKALGETDATAGYLPELVIKGNKTTLEYGGGLCQIATTMFRTALASGLPITERRNHSYRVSYYEPAGTDATIYIPNPDLKFKNDTGNNILIQTRFEGTNDIYFDFWGKSDGRVVTSTYPVIYNIVKPAPTKIIETTELPVGQKKCTESAHAGAEAYFDYTVIYNAGTENENKVETRFSSKYVPWQAVCLVGVEKLSEATSTSATASTTISITTSTNPISTSTNSMTATTTE